MKLTVAYESIIFFLQRLNPEIASNVCQILLWAPSAWLKAGALKIPTSAEVILIFPPCTIIFNESIFVDLRMVAMLNDEGPMRR